MGKEEEDITLGRREDHVHKHRDKEHHRWRENHKVGCVDVRVTKAGKLQVTLTLL